MQRPHGTAFFVGPISEPRARESGKGILEHVRQAEHALSILIVECEDGQDVEEAA